MERRIGRDGNRKRPQGNFDRRTDTTHGNGHLARSEYRRAAVHASEATRSPRRAQIPRHGGQWRAAERIARSIDKAGNKDSLAARPETTGVLYIALKNSP